MKWRDHSAVIRQRGQRERQAREWLARCQTQMAERQRELDHVLLLQQQYNDPVGLTDIATLRGAHQFRLRLLEARVQQRDAVERAQQEVQRAVELWREASTALQAIEQLQQAQTEARHQRRELLEQTENDDNAAAAYARRQSVN